MRLNPLYHNPATECKRLVTLVHMGTQNHLFPAGFGQRLREERKRLGLNQEQLAELAGIQRLAQGQYETEAREPRISYVAALGAAGVDLYFLLFGRRIDESGLTPDQRADIERRTFNLIEDYVTAQCGGQLSADGRLVLFRIIRSRLARAVLEGSSTDITIADVMSGGGG